MVMTFKAYTPTRHVDVGGSTLWEVQGAEANVTWGVSDALVTLTPSGDRNSSCVIAGTKPGMVELTMSDGVTTLRKQLMIGGLLAYGPDGQLYGTYAKDWQPVWRGQGLPTNDAMTNGKYPFAFIPPTQSTDVFDGNDDTINVACYLISVPAMRSLVSNSDDTMVSQGNVPVTYDGQTTVLTVIPDGTGLIAQYMRQTGDDLTTVTRVDPKVHIESNVEGAVVVPSNISLDGKSYHARWSGHVRVDTEGDYTFKLDRNSCVRLWLDGELKINWWAAATNVKSATVRLQPGRIRILVECQVGSTSNKLVLKWIPPGGTEQIIPQECLYPFN